MNSMIFTGLCEYSGPKLECLRDRLLVCVREEIDRFVPAVNAGRKDVVEDSIATQATGRLGQEFG
ncbi:MAG: hypothetical protein ACRER2_10145 [Methylococcales bacterium]